MESKQLGLIPQKQVHLYLPAPNLKFSNQLLMSKMVVPHPTNISLQSSRMQRCHDLKKRKDCQSMHERNGKDIDINSYRFSDKGITLNIGSANKRIYGNLQIRYNKRYGHHHHHSLDQQSKSIDSGNIPLTARQYLQRIKNSPKLQELKSLNQTIKQKQSNNEEQKFVRMSISRMLQKSNNRVAFDYLTKFYKRPIQRELAFKKVKKQSNNINEILNVAEIRPVSQQQKPTHKIHRSGQNRCKCVKHTIQVDINRLNKTSYAFKRSEKSSEAKSQRKLATSDNHRKQFILSPPQNWTVDSWNTQNKYFPENSGVLEKTDFKE